MCPKSDFSYKIHGSFAGEVTNFLGIAVRQCNQSYLNVKYNNTKQCVNNSEMVRVASNLKLWLIVQDSHFEVDDFSGSPIQPTNKPYYLTSFANRSMQYYMKVSMN